MARLISIFSVGDLKKILPYVEQNGVQDVFECFPFAELASSNGMDYECIRYQLELLEKFLNIKEFYSSDRLKCIVDYLLQHLKFMVKRKNDVLLPLLHFLGEIFTRYKFFSDESNYQVPTDQIGRLLVSLFNSQQEIAEKRAGVLLLTELLDVTKITLSESKLIENCIEQCFEILDEKYAVDLCRLTYAVLGMMADGIPSKSRVLYWLKSVCPGLLVLDTEELVLNELLKCILQTYHKNKGYLRNFCLKLSKVYVKKIDVICTLFSNPSLTEFCSHLLIYIVRDMCILERLPRAALYDEKFLKELLSLKTCTNMFPICDQNVIFVLIYLQYINDESFFVAKHIVANELLTRCHSGKAYTLPTLKALCLLYPVIIEYGEYPINLMFIEDILATLFKSEHFSQLITYDPDQLTWFLTRGNYRLRLKALFLWLLNFNDNAVILAVIDSCEASQLLIDIVVHSSNVNESVCHRAAELLGRLQSPSLGKTLRKNLVSSKAIGYILEANPDFPTDEKEGVFFCKVMSFRLPYLEDKKFFTLGCYYSIKLLARFKTNSKGVEQFCWNKKCLEQVLLAASSDDDSVATAATKLLKTLALLQKRHETKMPVSSTIDFKPFLKGSKERLSQSLLFLYAILECKVPVPIVKLAENSGLALLHRLLDLEDDMQVSAKQFKTLQRLLDVEKYLSNSMLTPLFVRAQCMRPIHQSYTSELLSFLKQWMSNLHGLEFHVLPFGFFEKFLKEIRQHSHQEQVDELLVLLYKWKDFDY